MSNDLVTYKELTAEQLMEITGQSTGKKQSDFPRLGINKEGADEQKRPLPVGSYVVSQGGLAVYGEPVFLRPYVNCYYYAQYDEPSNTYPNRTILIKNFNEEALDEQGGIACGRVPKKQRDGMTEAQVAVQETIKCYRVVYGVVTFNGVAADGIKHEIKELPVRMRLSGDNFMPIQAAFDTLLSKKIPMLTSILTLTTKRKKQGSNVWYQMVPEVDTNNVVTLKDTDWELLKDFQASIDRENKYVVDKHKAANKTAKTISNEVEIITALEADFASDDISDVGN